MNFRPQHAHFNAFFTFELELIFDVFFFFVVVVIVVVVFFYDAIHRQDHLFNLF